MTREEAVSVLNMVEAHGPLVIKAKKMAIEALKQTEQPTEVQDILQYLDEYLHPIISPEHWSVYSELYDMISMLPSAQLEQKKGKWIGKPIAGYATVRCSVCNDVFCENTGRWNYCPNCGAKMEEEE